jgi:catalase
MPSKQVTDNDNAVYTTSNGAPVAQPYAAEKIGVHGPLFLQGPCRTHGSADHPRSLTFTPDFHHIDLLAHFDRERIPERVVRDILSALTYISVSPLEFFYRSMPRVLARTATSQ